jgi:hypothetical protein
VDSFLEREVLTLRSFKISLVPTDHSGHEHDQKSLLPRYSSHKRVVEIALDKGEDSKSVHQFSGE